MSPVERYNGLERMRAVIERRAFSIGGVLGINFVEVERGRAVLMGVPQAEVLNLMGVAHGGWVLTMLDSCMGFASQSVMDVGAYCTTLETKGNMVRSIREGEEVRAVGSVLHHGRGIVTAEGKVTDSNGRLLAHGTATLKVVTVA